MFLFSHKTKTPISTYTDSYRAPTSIKEVYKDPPLWAWEANKFVTPGLTQTMKRHTDPEALQKMAKCAVQDYSYKSSMSGHPYLPERYWLSQEEDGTQVTSRRPVVPRETTMSSTQSLCPIPIPTIVAVRPGLARLRG
ncbi:hypothetical protein H920_03209 [Fukomys damarensis]|uniref:Spermatid-specific manchette-related protein 1 n=1 Tax=Fukomys damarensis TaxID=885580 RepID=A0A091EIM5_FUKDA|nr:hypothetical protein H920_03209 [Fukomys damarensis]